MISLNSVSSLTDSWNLYPEEVTKSIEEQDLLYLIEVKIKISNILSNCSEDDYLKNLQEIGHAVNQIAWGENNKDLIRNKFGLKNRANNNQPEKVDQKSSKLLVKLDFEGLAYLIELKNLPTNNMEKINKSLERIDAKVDFILKYYYKDGTETVLEKYNLKINNSYHDVLKYEDVGYLMFIAALNHDMKCLKIILKTFKEMEQDPYISLDLKKDVDRYYFGRMVSELGRARNEMSNLAKDSKNKKITPALKKLSNLENFRNKIAKLPEFLHEINVIKVEKLKITLEAFRFENATLPKDLLGLLNEIESKDLETYEELNPTSKNAAVGDPKTKPPKQVRDYFKDFNEGLKKCVKTYDVSEDIEITCFLDGLTDVISDLEASVNSVDQSKFDVTEKHRKRNQLSVLKTILDAVFHDTSIRESLKGKTIKDHINSLKPINTTKNAKEETKEDHKNSSEPLEINSSKIDQTKGEKTLEQLRNALKFLVHEIKQLRIFTQVLNDAEAKDQSKITKAIEMSVGVIGFLYTKILYPDSPDSIVKSFFHKTYAGKDRSGAIRYRNKVLMHSILDCDSVELYKLVKEDILPWQEAVESLLWCLSKKSKRHEKKSCFHTMDNHFLTDELEDFDNESREIVISLAKLMIFNQLGLTNDAHQEYMMITKKITHMKTIKVELMIEYHLAEAHVCFHRNDFIKSIDSYKKILSELNKVKRADLNERYSGFVNNKLFYYYLLNGNHEVAKQYMNKGVLNTSFSQSDLMKMDDTLKDAYSRIESSKCRFLSESLLEIIYLTYNVQQNTQQISF